ncbi:MAG: metal-dependent transcriptional regulator [Acidimicrobiales bacterium]
MPTTGATESAGHGPITEAHPAVTGSVSPANLRYLEAAYYLAGEGEVIRRARLASWLGISAPAVTQGVARLVRDGLLEDGPNQELELTPEGERVARDVVRRHRIIEVWAVMTLGLDWVSADDEAQRVAPVISEEALERLHEQLGRPSCCPHGNHIPGEPAPQRSSRRLVDLAPGAAGVVERISELAEHDAHEVLDIAYNARLLPGMRVTVMAVERDGAMVLDVDGSEARIWPRVASAVWVAEPPA